MEASRKRKRLVTPKPFQVQKILRDPLSSVASEVNIKMFAPHQFAVPALPPRKKPTKKLQYRIPKIKNPEKKVESGGGSSSSSSLSNANEERMEVMESKKEPEYPEHRAGPRTNSVIWGPLCGHPNPRSSDYCSLCGFNLWQNLLCCRNCLTDLFNGQVYCHRCGKERPPRPQQE